jgi:hypothetical protein
MRFLEDFTSQFGFHDGDLWLPNYRELQAAYLRVINAALEAEGSQCRVVEGLAWASHNEFMIDVLGLDGKARDWDESVDSLSVDAAFMKMDSEIKPDESCVAEEERAGPIYEAYGWFVMAVEEEWGSSVVCEAYRRYLETLECAENFDNRALLSEAIEGKALDIWALQSVKRERARLWYYIDRLEETLEEALNVCV